MSRDLVIDADTHYYETLDCFTRHADPALVERGPHWRTDSNGKQKLFVGDKPFTFFTDPSWKLMPPAGSLADFLRRGIHKPGVDGDDGVEISKPDPAYVSDRDARLALLDQQRLDATLLFPTLGITVEHFMTDDVEATYASLRSFNDWLDEQWGFNYKGRLISPPMMSLLDVDRAVEELERVLAMGARMVHLRPGPQGNRSPADPVFDPFWARLNEARIPVAFHAAESGYNQRFSTAFGENPNPSSHTISAWQWTNTFGDRPIMDTISALIFGNLFGRFPNLNVASIENGSVWVDYLLTVMDKMKGMGRNGLWQGGYFKGKPSEVFKRHVFVSPFFEEDLEALVDRIGASRVLFGSDHPHIEGLSDPVTFEESVSSRSDEERRMIMGGNASALLGLAA
ncbi:MAG: amidohydrolase family protein [Phycisphaerales bacterium JB058]